MWKAGLRSHRCNLIEKPCVTGSTEQSDEKPVTLIMDERSQDVSRKKQQQINSKYTISVNKIDTHIEICNIRIYICILTILPKLKKDSLSS